MSERPNSAEKDAGLVDELTALLAEHEERWTTHGYQRMYDVIHCPGECGWSLRQKVLMSDADCLEAHRRHVAEVIAARITPPGGQP